jgi:hypothetical protein
MGFHEIEGVLYSSLRVCCVHGISEAFEGIFVKFTDGF